MPPDSRVFVVALQLGISPSAGLAGRPPWSVKGRLPLRFDFDKPAVWVASRNDTPTIFATRQEAERKIEDFLARVRGIIRVSQATGKSVDVGCASMLLGWDAGDGKPLGGYEIVPYTTYLAEKDEIARFHEQVEAERLAAADVAATQAQQVADQLRAEFKPTSVPRRAFTPASGGWVAVPDVPKVQTYQRQDGTESFRARDGGRVSQGFDTNEEAQGWLAGDRATPTITPEQRARMEALRDKVIR